MYRKSKSFGIQKYHCMCKHFNKYTTTVTLFNIAGGVIEACPPSDSITTVTVDMLIEPNGKYSIQCCGDQIHAESPFSCWGMSVPQSSVEPDVMNTACSKVAEACKTRGILGYLSVDFVTFIDPKTVSYKGLKLLIILLKYFRFIAKKIVYINFY